MDVKPSSTAAAPPSSSSTSVSAIKSRIITHMNADHSNSLSLYLQHYNHIPAPHSSTARLADITPTHLILTSSYGRTIIPLDPPLQASLSDARTRLVAMHAEARDALGLSDTVVDTYRPPTAPFHLFMLTMSCVVAASFSSARNLQPETGGWVYAAWSLGGSAPGLAAFAALLRPWVFWFIILVHGAEAVWLMAMGRCRAYGVQMGSRLWWLWVGNQFLEGFTVCQRFDGVVREKEEMKKKAKQQQGKH